MEAASFAAAESLLASLAASLAAFAACDAAAASAGAVDGAGVTTVVEGGGDEGAGVTTTGGAGRLSHAPSASAATAVQSKILFMTSPNEKVTEIVGSSFRDLDADCMRTQRR